MRFLRGLLDRLLLVSAIVAGGLVPGFISQYVQRLGGRLDQARFDLAPWQAIADHYFHGNLGRLIQYHLSSPDPTFHAEGAAISTLLTATQHLQAEVAALQGNVFQQAAYLAFHGDAGVARATLGDWVPTIGLSADGLLFALILAVIVWVVFQASWSIIALGSRRLSKRSGLPPGRPSAGSTSL